MTAPDALRAALAAIREREQKATKGPWRWWCNAKSKQVYLATVEYGRRFVMTFRRFSMQNAQPEFQVDERMIPASQLGEPNHNGEISVQHPDAVFIAAARQDVPALLRAVEVLAEALDAAGYALRSDGIASPLIDAALAEAARVLNEGQK